MNMTPDVLELWLHATLPEGPEREADASRWRERFADPVQRRRWFVAVEDGQVHGFTSLFETGPQQLGLRTPRTLGGKPIGPQAASLIDEAVAAASTEGARVLGLRVPAQSVSPALCDAIERTQGAEIGGRIEFKTPLDQLPEEDPTSPLTWRPGRVREEVVALLAAAATNTPDGLEPGEVPEDVVASWLRPSDLNTDPGAVLHLGAIDGRDVALVCAQVCPEDGWSTLTYMGLVPEARGRGLGHHIQRHGLAMLRAQGGQLYHGGTSLENHAMRACFVRQGCQEFKRFRQFRWLLAAHERSGQVVA